MRDELKAEKVESDQRWSENQKLSGQRDVFKEHAESLKQERNRFKAQAEEAKTKLDTCSEKVNTPTGTKLVATPLEYLTLDRRIKNLLHFRYTYTVYTREGEVLTHDTGPIEGHTAKSVKHFMVKRFHLQTGVAGRASPTARTKNRIDAHVPVNVAPSVSNPYKYPF